MGGRVSVEAFDWDAEPAPAPRATHVYVDEQGVPLYRTVRELRPGSKRVWQERHVAGEVYEPGLGDARLVLYRLPVVLAQAARGGLVYVVEGERCAEALERLLLVATTSPLGAGKWRPEYAAMLAGALVVAIPDCDRPGRLHALDVLDTCHVGGRCRVLEPLELGWHEPEGWDVLDELAAVAETLRAVEPAIGVEEVRRRLRELVLCWTRSLLPYRPGHYREKVTARPGSVWLECERCGRRRAHELRAGIAYCTCCGNRRP
jgi:hypothetical protein